LALLDLCHSVGVFLETLTPLVGRHELFDSGIPAIDGKHASLSIDCNAVGKVELPFSIPEPAPLGNEIAFFIELLDAVIARVRYIDIADAIDRDAPGRP
jgi:hypothetical protein